MPRISFFFGIVVYMYFDDHNPQHFHVAYEGLEAICDFDGKILGSSGFCVDKRFPPLQGEGQGGDGVKRLPKEEINGRLFTKGGIN